MLNASQVTATSALWAASCGNNSWRAHRLSLLRPPTTSSNLFTSLSRSTSHSTASTHEVIDLLREVDHLGEILNFVDAASAPRICRYLLSCAHFLPEGEEAEVLNVAERVCRKADMWPDALRCAARIGDPEAVQQVFNDAPDGVVKKQLALMAGSLQLNIVTDNEELQALCGNSRLSSCYLQLAKHLNVSEAELPDEIVKTTDTTLAGGKEDAKKNLATSTISALTNAGHCNDKVLSATVAIGATGAKWCMLLPCTPP